MTKPPDHQPVPGKLEQAATTAPPLPPDAGGPPPGPPFRGPNAGVGMGRPSEDDRAGPHDHDGWNSNT